jgi:hypothetical protein
MDHPRWPRISRDVMAAVRRAVTEVLVLHDAEAHVEVMVRLQPTTRQRLRTVAVEVDAEPANDERECDERDRVEVAQDARYRALEL